MTAPRGARSAGGRWHDRGAERTDRAVTFGERPPLGGGGASGAAVGGRSGCCGEAATTKDILTAALYFFLEFKPRYLNNLGITFGSSARGHVFPELDGE